MNTQRILVVPYGMPEGDIYTMLAVEGCCAFWTKPDCISAYVLVETSQAAPVADQLAEPEVS
jgi:hypothetical protein